MIIPPGTSPVRPASYAGERRPLAVDLFSEFNLT